MSKFVHKILAVSLLFFFTLSIAISQEAGDKKAVADSELLLPPNAKPGECYARVFTPPAYNTESEKVLKRQASEQIEIIPAKYEWVEEKVLIKDTSYELEVVPGEYDTVEEKVMVKPATKEVKEIPAEYEWVEEKILDKPAYTVWKKGRGPIERIDNGTGEIMCLVEIPATYKTVKKQVVKKPASTAEVEIPAEFVTVKKVVTKTEPTTRKVEIPAEYKTVKTLKLVSEAKINKTPIPEEYEDITKTVKVSEGKMEWRPVLCETNLTPEVITSIQNALQSAGYYKGPIDGAIGSQSIAALKSFQREKGMSEGGLTIESLKELGVIQ